MFKICIRFLNVDCRSAFFKSLRRMHVCLEDMYTCFGKCRVLILQLFKSLEESGFIYSRLTNPTVSVFQERVASLEGGVGATCTASGHSAQLLALFAVLDIGYEFVASTKLYVGSITQFFLTFKYFGWSV